MSTSAPAALAAAAQQQDETFRKVMRVLVVGLLVLGVPMVPLNHPKLGTVAVSPVQVCTAYSLDRKMIEPWMAVAALTPTAAAHNAARRLRCGVFKQKRACQRSDVWADDILTSLRPLYRAKDVVTAVSSTFGDDARSQLFVAGCWFFAAASLFAVMHSSILSVLGAGMMMLACFQAGVKPLWGTYLLGYLVAVTFRSPGLRSRRMRMAQRAQQVQRIREREAAERSRKERDAEVQRAKEVLEGARGPGGEEVVVGGAADGAGKKDK
ncbi:unnamed protein product [Pedinophyceae sp. YPF-701]|nr:unnamed protein product [Pedinophyceae sp. YPF-701]